MRPSKKRLETQAARRAKKGLRALKQAKFTILEFNPNDEPNFDDPIDDSDSLSGSESDEFEFDDDTWKSFVDFDVVNKNVLDLDSDDSKLHWIPGADAKFRALNMSSVT